MMNDTELKKFIEKEFDEFKDIEARRGHLIPQEIGFKDALDMIYKEKGFGKLQGYGINREGKV